MVVYYHVLTKIGFVADFLWAHQIGINDAYLIYQSMNLKCNDVDAYIKKIDPNHNSIVVSKFIRKLSNAVQKAIN